MDIGDAERDIAHLRGQLSSAARQDRSQDQRLATLETENAELKLYLAALLRLLRQKGTVTDDELRAIACHAAGVGPRGRRRRRTCRRKRVWGGVVMDSESKK